MKKYLLLALASFSLSACGTWHTSNVNRDANAPATTMAANPANITVSEGDSDRAYTKLGDIKVTVRKATVFDSDPSREKANEALREEAANLGADAVINATYGTVEIGLMSWGQMEASGTAISYTK